MSFQEVKFPVHVALHSIWLRSLVRLYSACGLSAVVTYNISALERGGNDLFCTLQQWVSNF